MVKCVLRMSRSKETDGLHKNAVMMARSCTLPEEFHLARGASMMIRRARCFLSAAMGLRLRPGSHG